MVRYFVTLKLLKMNTNNKFFIGIDVSKPFFDASLLVVENHQKKGIETAKFDNDTAGLKSFEKWLKSFKVSFDDNSILVIENTGIYHRALWSFCGNKSLPIHIGNAAHIKWSFGIARGKNDKIDSIRLCQYAQKHVDELKCTAVLNPVLLQLKDLMTSRSRLLTQINANKVYITELKSMTDKAIQSTLEKAFKNAIEGITKSIKNIEAIIRKIIANDTALQTNYDLLISVPSIDRKSTRLNSSHPVSSRMPSSA